MTRDFLSIDDLTPVELEHLLTLSGKVKASPDDYAGRLNGKAVALIFEKPSTRTRVSFEVAVASMGGHPLALSSSELQLGRGETIEDTGRVLSRYVDAIVLRTFGQERLVALAEGASVPVVNSLSDHEHPCQILADLLTVFEHKGSLPGRTLAYLGDGNNVAHSLLLGGAKSGMRVRVGTPEGFEPDQSVVRRSEEIAAEMGGGVEITNDPSGAASGADVLYTDVWASMGQEGEHDARVRIMEPCRLDAEMVARAAPDAIVMHCLPAHRGEEITDEVIDGPRSVVWDQAENRLHTQKALLLWLLGAE
ncbi:MAG TPA: ornithine carbamoyltransferase [Actinomycetota bacterium]|nr:ornithine carbamoyltransferase [Actinomycetota bacterium]